MSWEWVVVTTDQKDHLYYQHQIKNLILRPGCLMMLGTEQTKQGIKHKKNLDFRFQTRAPEVQMEIGRNCETVIEWCINIPSMIRSGKAPWNQRNNRLLPNTNGNVKEWAKGIFKNWSRVAGLSLGVGATHSHPMARHHYTGGQTSDFLLCYTQ